MGVVYIRSTVGKAQDVVRQMVSSPLFNVPQLESLVIHRLQRKFGGGEVDESMKA